MKSRKIMDKILGVFVVTVMCILVLDVVWNVFSRYILNNPSSFTVELARYLLIWVGLFGSAYATGQKEHLAIELFPQTLQRKNPAKKRILDIVLNSLIALFALIVMVVGGSRLVFITFELNQISSTLQVPLGYVYLSLPISGLLIMFYTIHEIIYGIPEHLERVYE